jgi:hypothetical protein
MCNYISNVKRLREMSQRAMSAVGSPVKTSPLENEKIY